MSAGLCQLAAHEGTMIDDPVVVDALTKAGWCAGRTVPTSGAEGALAREGHPVWGGLLAFLGEFTGLTVRFVRNGREDAAWFDAERATTWADAAAVRDYEKTLSTRLAPVGYAHHDHLMLLASQDGRFVGAYDDFLADLGRSPEELLRRLLSGQVPPVSATGAAPC